MKVLVSVCKDELAQPKRSLDCESTISLCESMNEFNDQNIRIQLNAKLNPLKVQLSKFTPSSQVY